MNRFQISFVLLFVLILSGCMGNYIPMKSEPAFIGPKTRVTDELKSLPAPKEKIVAAVYKFRDQTGQYKSSEVGTSWSTAVTQGATSILLKALEESGWFIPIEREGLSNLLNERKIIRSSRATYNESIGNDQLLLPPLLFAGIVLEGGITSYETNLMTGGFGAKYFNAGGGTEYRKDRVTVYLRAISTSNGRILKTVYTTKTILSQLVDVGLFRFVDVKRLLEVEAGFSTNEPPEMCVTEAIEKAVYSLVIEGAIDGLWQLKDSTALSSEFINNYLEEKAEQENIDPFGNEVISKRRPFGIGANFGGSIYAGDYGNARTKASWSLNAHLALNDRFYFGLDYSIGQLANERYFESNFHDFGLSGYLHLIPNSYFSPYLIMGAGALITKLEDHTKPFGKDSKSKTNLSLTGGLGVEYFAADFLALNMMGRYTYIFSDEIDGADFGSMNDYFWGIQFGFTIYPRF